MSTLKKQAEDLGIEVNPRWSEETLKKKIDEAKDAKQAEEARALEGAPAAAAPIAAQVGAAIADDGTVLQTEDTPKAKKAHLDIDVKTRLIITAEQLNVEVDEDWDEDRLRAEIQQALEGRADNQVKGAVPKPETAAIDYDPATVAAKSANSSYTLISDYWDKDGNRIKAGSEVQLPDDEAHRLGPNVLKPKSIFG